MKQVVAAILFFLGSITLAGAQETPTPIPTPPQGFPLQTFVMCDTKEAMHEVLNKYGEYPIVEGQGTFFVQGGQVLQGTMQFWGNTETKSFTVTIDNGQFMCMLTNGKDLKPVVPEATL